MTWLNEWGTFMQHSESFGSGVSVVGVVASMALWALFGPTR